MELKGDGVMRDKNLKAKKKTKKEATLKNMMDHCDGAVKNKNLKADETEKPIVVSLEEAAAKMEPSHLADFLNVRSVSNLDLLRFYFYFESAFDQVSWTWVKMFKESLLSTLINVIPIKNEHDSYDELCNFVHKVSTLSPTRHFIVHSRKALLGGISPADNRRIPPLTTIAYSNLGNTSYYCL
ncbi:hypothetical protein DY000_02063700 [Brassica cretica]|uniref:Uncharacterized protein n=1 Tax=Brassica cretica TaxID=69181 RepID=A0ABQ7B0P9_BRACR|nr:hypothetical protein DY000_02063700 [Brassica cretica]